MTAEVVAIQILLAVVLFFAMNWIGGHSVVTSAYHQVSYFSRHDEAPAFNVFFRVLAPNVFIVLAATVFYSTRFPRFVTNLYAVVVYQQLIRWIFIFSMNRWRLTKWSRQLAVAGITWALAWLAYRTILIDPQRLLPDANNLTNELWLLVIVFVYKLFDSVSTVAGGNDKKKEDYLRIQYHNMKDRYARVVDGVVPNSLLHPLVYAVLICERFNRPALLQYLERLIPSSGPRTYGPMQCA